MRDVALLLWGVQTGAVQGAGPQKGRDVWREPRRDVIDSAQGWSGQASQRRGHFSRDLHVEKKQKLSDT